MAILPLFCGEAIFGLTIGCLISNLLGNGILDIIFGTLATLVSAVFTYFIGRKIKKDIPRFLIGGFFPIILNIFGTKYMYKAQKFNLFCGFGVKIYL